MNRKKSHVYLKRETEDGEKGEGEEKWKRRLGCSEMVGLKPTTFLNIMKGVVQVKCESEEVGVKDREKERMKNAIDEFMKAYYIGEVLKMMTLISESEKRSLSLIGS